MNGVYAIREEHQMNERRAPQATAGVEALEQEHHHDALVHTHDHYHVTHVHRSDAAPGQEFEHRAQYHVHEHNHAEYVHGHAYPEAAEGFEHAKIGHVHDHGAPAEPRSEGA